MSTSLEELFQQGVKNLSEGNFLEAEKCFEKLHNSNSTLKLIKSFKYISSLFVLGKDDL